MIYDIILYAVVCGWATLMTLCYHEEKKAHRSTISRAKSIIDEHHEIMAEMEEENTRLAIVARAYRIAALNTPEK